MRRTRPEPRVRAARGVTLIELVVAMVLVAIIVGATIYFVYPLRQAVDLTVRAELTDVADNTLQRMGREIRLALPNSVRLATNGGSQFVEFLAVSTAGRYRADGYAGTPHTGTSCDPLLPDSDQLLFDVADDCFKPIGTIGATIGVANRLVLNNYGTGFADQNAYETSADRNWRQISAAATAGTNDRIRFTATATPFKRVLHDSPGRRFYIISGPVTYECNLTTRTVSRRSEYAIAASQPDDPAEFVGGGAPAVIANDVTGCAFSYSANVAAQVGLLTLLLTLSRVRSDGGNETVTLYHAVHVSNVP